MPECELKAESLMYVGKSRSSQSVGVAADASPLYTDRTVRIMYIMLNSVLCNVSHDIAFLWLLTIKETNPGQKKYLKINAAQEMLPRRGSLAARPCAVKKETPEA